MKAKQSFVLLIMMCVFGVMAAAAETQEITIKGAVGSLSAALTKPDTDKKVPLVILLHGFTSSKNDRLIAAIADALYKRGFASLRFDFNGHGDSDGDFVNMTVLNEIDDAKAVYEYARQLDFVSSISLAGHSQGGVVASMTAGLLGAKKIKALVLLAPAAVLREDALRGTIMGIGYDAVNPPAFVPLWDNLQLGQDYIKTAQTLHIFETAQTYGGPVCLIHGTSDTIAPYSYSERYDSVYKKSTLHLISADDHVFSHQFDEAVQTAVDFLAKNGR